MTTTRPGRLRGLRDAVGSALGGAVVDTVQPALVRAVGAYGLSSGSTLELPDRPLSDAAWAELLLQAGAERILGPLLTAGTAGDLPMTPAQLDEVRAHATDALRLCLALEGELLRSAALLGEAAVEFRVLKGPAVATLDYHDPAMRSFVDVDLLLRSEELDRAVVALLTAGYERRRPERRPGYDHRFGKGLSIRSPSGLFLDLHRTFAVGPFGFQIVLDDLWEHEDAFSVGGVAMSALPREVRLLHACYHAVLGDWPRRLVPHRDIAQIALSRELDEARVLELARRWDAEILLSTGLVSAWRLLGVAESTGLSTWAHGFRPSAAHRRVLSRYATSGPRYAALDVSALRVIPGLRAKAAFATALVWPDPSYVRARYGSRSSRGLHGVRRAVSSLRREE